MKKISSVIAVLCVMVAFYLRFAYGLDKIVEISILSLIAFLILLVFEIFPVTLTCFLTVGMMPIIGVTADFNTALSGFSNQVVYFILASFGFALAMTKSTLSKRLLRVLIQKFGKNSKLLVLSFMVCAAILSSLISNLPICALFLAVAQELLKCYPEAERKQTGKTLMIGISISSMIGGVMTPAGSSLNLLAISMLNDYTGHTVTFVQWMSVGIPVAILVLPLSWMILVKIHPPSEIKKEDLTAFIDGFHIPDKFTAGDKKVLLVTGTMLFFWVLSSWVPQINIMVVAVIGCVLFCAPKFGVVDMQEFLESVNWDTFFLVGTVLSVGATLVRNGVSDVLTAFLPEMSGTAAILVLMFIAFLTFALLVVIPGGHTIVTFLAPVVTEIAVTAGIFPGLAITVFGICACNCYILPLDAVCLLTYSKGYYKMTEMTKVTLPLQISIIGIVGVVGTVVGKLFGWL